MITQSLNTSPTQATVSNKKLGRLTDLLAPVLRKHIRNERQAQTVIEARMFVEGFDHLMAELMDKLTRTFAVTVDYSRTLADMVEAGKYGEVDETIADQNFPWKNGVENIQIYLFNARHDGATFSEEFTQSVDIVLTRMDELGLRPATLPELLAFGEKYPDKQREVKITALGSRWKYEGKLHSLKNGESAYPELTHYKGVCYGRRQLFITSGYCWGSSDEYFAAVPKQ
jgi:hypothetical protein